MSVKAILIASLAAMSMAAPAPQFGGGSTKNDVKNGGACKAYSYFFARGTTEIGNMGSTVGPALEKALEKLVGADKLATQGITYPASIAGTAVGSMSPKNAEGAKVMAQLVTQVKQKCPDTKVIIAGYSQGAQQVHGALINLKEGDVDAAVTFGDPLKAQAFKNIDKSKTKIFCNAGDGVCMNAFIISPAHLSYAMDGSVGKAASFAVEAAGTGGSSASSGSSGSSDSGYSSDSSDSSDSTASTGSTGSAKSRLASMFGGSSGSSDSSDSTGSATSRFSKLFGGSK